MNLAKWTFLVLLHGKLAGAELSWWWVFAPIYLDLVLLSINGVIKTRKRQAIMNQARATAAQVRKKGGES